jgi:catechol 2,3-dioxygenase
MTSRIHPETRVGHVHLEVAALDGAIAFNSGVLGFELTRRLGPGAAFLSMGNAPPSIRTRVAERQAGLDS